jgi:hypothetical protein
VYDRRERAVLPKILISRADHWTNIHVSSLNNSARPKVKADENLFIASRNTHSSAITAAGRPKKQA